MKISYIDRSYPCDNERVRKSKIQEDKNNRHRDYKGEFLAVYNDSGGKTRTRRRRVGH